jgi:hypothetical protein
MSIRGPTLAAALLLATAGAASAQQYNFFDDYCTVGAIRTCASVRLRTEWDATLGRTNVQIWIRNLQGTLAQENTGGAPISRVGLTFPNITNPSNLTIQTVGTAVTVGTPAPLWKITNQQIEGLVTFSTAAHTEGAVMGCNVYPGQTLNYYQTCGTGGWVVFGFSTSNQWSASSAQIAWKVQTHPGVNTFLACRTADLPGDPEYCESVNPTVTPEPVTLALFGTGLAGLGAVRRRKRRGSENATE